MNPKEIIKRNETVANKIYKAVEKLPRGEVIGILEAIKIDLILNGKIITLDGYEGVVKQKKKGKGGGKDAGKV